MAAKFRLTDEEVLELFSEQLPDLLDRRPDLEQPIYRAFWRAFMTREEAAAILSELRAFRSETSQRFEQVDQRFEQMDQRFEQMDQRFEQMDQRFEQMDQRFEQVDQRFEQVDQRFESLETRMEAGFKSLERAIDRLGARWGIRSESVFRQTMANVLEQSFGVQVEQRTIQGEQFDCIIFDGQHILVEIAASTGPQMHKRLMRKRLLYEQATGIKPTRFILATASIHSNRALALRNAGFDVIEPEEDVIDD